MADPQQIAAEREARDWLRENQGRCRDSAKVRVSRQALDEVLDALDRYHARALKEKTDV